MIRTAVVLIVTLLATTLWVTPASAEDPILVSDEVLRTGVFVAPARRTQVDYAALVAVVAEASNDGVELGIVVPFAPFPDNKAFALRVQQAADVDAVISISPDGVIDVSTSDDYAGAEVRALDAARRTTGSADVVSRAFVQELVNVPERSTPGLISSLIRYVFYMLFVLVAAVIAEHFVRQFKHRRRRKAALAARPAPELTIDADGQTQREATSAKV